MSKNLLVNSAGRAERLVAGQIVKKLDIYRVSGAG